MSRREAQHGTTWRYRDHHCRCEPCTEAQRVAMADYYVRHPEQVEKKREAMRRLRAKV